MNKIVGFLSALRLFLLIIKEYNELKEARKKGKLKFRDAVRKAREEAKKKHEDNKKKGPEGVSRRNDDLIRK